MNAPKRHSRPSPNQPTNTAIKGGGTSKIKSGGSSTTYDQWGEPVGKKSWKQGKVRTTWGA